MQTFLPYPDFYRCASVLDPKRLGNQFYREGLTLLRGHWPHHPASRMWHNALGVLCEYLLACCHELEARGYDYPQHRREVEQCLQHYADQLTPPWWLGWPPLHASHRAALLHKNFKWYKQFGWTEQPTPKVLWPPTIRPM